MGVISSTGRAPDS